MIGIGLYEILKNKFNIVKSNLVLSSLIKLDINA